MTKREQVQIALDRMNALLHKSEEEQYIDTGDLIEATLDLGKVVEEWLSEEGVSND